MNLNRSISLISGVIWASLILLITLSPLSEYGEHATQFNTMSMWGQIIGIFCLFLLPVLFELLQWPRTAKYTLAILLGIFLVIALAMIFILIGFMSIKGLNAYLGSILTLLLVFAFCGLSWYVLTFSEANLNRVR